MKENGKEFQESGTTGEGQSSSPQKTDQKDTRLVETLEESGDSLEIPREIEHRSCFPDSRSLASFIAEIRQLGFEIVEEPQSGDEPEEAPEPDLPHAVCFSRVDDVDGDSIDTLTTELLRLAKANEGRYDGWGTHVVTERAEDLS